MPLTIPCEHCASDVPFEEHDRGAEVYCPSCGRANLVPPAELPLPDRPDARVFSADTVRRLETEVIGQTACLCGADVPITLEEVGGPVYCPSCGAEVRATVPDVPPPATQTTLTAAEPEPGVPGETDSAATEAVPDGEARPHRGWGVRRAALAVVALAVLAGVYFAWRPPDLAAPGAGDGRPAVTDPTAGITIARVLSLLEWQDRQRAMVQARLWQQALVEGKVGPDEPRRAKLVEVVRALEAELAPPPKPTPQYYVQFQNAVDALARALKARDLEAAHGACDAAERLLSQHREALAPRARRFKLLQEHLKLAETPGPGETELQALLVKARGALASGDVTGALELDARGRFLAPVTLLDDFESDRLISAYDGLKRDLRLARGKRTIDDARACQEAGDAAARNREVLRALELLPGLPHREVASLVEQLEPWAEEARLSAGTEEGPPPESEVARRIAARDRYEAVLERYAEADAAGLIGACGELESPSAEPAPSEEELAKARDCLMQVLQRSVEEKLANMPAAKDAARRQGLWSAARRLLDDAAPWKDDSRWQALDGRVRDSSLRPERESAPDAETPRGEP